MSSILHGLFFTRILPKTELWFWYTILKFLLQMRFIWLLNFRLWNIQITGAKENWDVMKALRSFLYLDFKENKILSKNIYFLAGPFAERSYMGLKCQLVVNFDSQFSTITVRDGHSAKIHLNFSYCVHK